jgi:hypothetical protein
MLAVAIIVCWIIICLWYFNPLMNLIPNTTVISSVLDPDQHSMVDLEGPKRAERKKRNEAKKTNN